MVKSGVADPATTRAGTPGGRASVRNRQVSSTSSSSASAASISISPTSGMGHLSLSSYASSADSESQELHQRRIAQSSTPGSSLWRDEPLDDDPFSLTRTASNSTNFRPSPLQTAGPRLLQPSRSSTYDLLSSDAVNPLARPNAHPSLPKAAPDAGNVVLCVPSTERGYGHAKDMTWQIWQNLR